MLSWLHKQLTPHPQAHSAATSAAAASAAQQPSAVRADDAHATAAAAATSDGGCPPITAAVAVAVLFTSIAAAGDCSAPPPPSLQLTHSRRLAPPSALAQSVGQSRRGNELIQVAQIQCDYWRVDLPAPKLTAALIALNRLFVAVAAPSQPDSRSCSRPPSPSGPHSHASPNSDGSLSGRLSSAAQSAPCSPRPPSIMRAEDEARADEAVGAAAAGFAPGLPHAHSPQHSQNPKDELSPGSTSACSTLLQRRHRLRASLPLPTPTPPDELLRQLTALHHELTGASAAQLAAGAFQTAVDAAGSYAVATPQIVAAKADSSRSRQLEWLRLGGFNLLLVLLQASIVHHGHIATSNAALQLQTCLLRLLRLLWTERGALAAQQRRSLQQQQKQQQQQRSKDEADPEAEALSELITELLTDCANDPSHTPCLEAATALQSECFAWASLLLPRIQPSHRLRWLRSATAVLRSWTTVTGSVPLLMATIAFLLRVVLSWPESGQRATLGSQTTLQATSVPAVPQQQLKSQLEMDLVICDIVPPITAAMSFLADQKEVPAEGCKTMIAHHCSSTASALTLCCLLLSKLILLGVDGMAAALIQRHALVALIARIMRRDLEGGFSSSPRSTASDGACLTPRLQSAGAHCLAFLLASQTPILADSSVSRSGDDSGHSTSSSSSFLLLNVQRQLLSSSVMPLLQSVLAAAASSNCPSSFGPMAADVAFAMFVIFGAPIGIDAGGSSRKATVESSDTKSLQPASSKTAAHLSEHDTSASLLTPTFLLSSCRGFFPLLLSLLSRWPTADSQCALCVQSLLSLLLHYPTVADQLLTTEGIIALICVRISDGLLRADLVEALLALLIELAAAATPACAQAVMGGDAAAQVLAMIDAVQAAYSARAPRADPHAEALRAQVDVLNRAVRELMQQHRADQAAEERARQRQSAAAAVGVNGPRSHRPDARFDFSGDRDQSLLMIPSSDSAIGSDFDPAPASSVFVEANSKSSANGHSSGHARGRRGSVSLSASMHTRTASSAPSSPRQMPQLKFGIDSGGLRAAHRMATLAVLRDMGC